MMKTLLIKLPINPKNRRDFEQLIQPYGLACISSFLKKNGHDVTLFDAQAHRLLTKEILEYIRNINPDIIGFSAMTCNLAVIISFLPEIKRFLPRVKIIIGGPHITAEPVSTLKNHPDVDIVVRGEGEYPCLELINAIENNKPLNSIKGIAYRMGNEIILNEAREPIMDLDSLPYADWESLPMDKYWAQITTKKNYVKFFASRGCPFQCTFCAAPRIMGKKLRKRSPSNIVGELILLYDKFKVRDVGFGDSTFNIDIKWMAEICEEIIKMKRPIIWRCNVRGRGLNKEIAKLMKRSGCVYITMGIESGDPVILKSTKKGETLDDFRRAVQIFREVNLPVLASFIIGLPGETEESIEKTLEFAKEIKIFSAGFNIAAPFPGTEFYEQAKKEGFTVDDWAKLNTAEVSYVPKEMTKKQLQDAYKRAVKKYYLRPTHLLRILLGMKSFSNLKIYLRSGFRVLQRRMRLKIKK